MSGPIVRKYGFPDFERIFGAKPDPHGAESASPSAPAAGTGLPADLPPAGEPIDPNAPEAAGTIAPTTEFGATGS